MRLTVLVLLLSVVGLLAPRRAQAAGTWSSLANTAPDSIGLMLLLSDGTVMCQQYENTNWYRLTPDTNGSYVNGTWTTLASMHDSRLYFVSQVLRDGRVLVTGGEYGSVTNTLSAEVYQPTNNTWTLTPNPGVVISDANSEVLPNGNVMVAPVEAGGSLDTLFYNIVSNTWSAGPSLLVDQNEATWVKLPDDSILTIDDNSTTSERFIPSLNRWIADATVPVNLYNYKSELGGGYLLPNGKVFFIGATNQTAIYTPTGTTNAGSWILGPVIPNNFGANDAPSAMMVNGKILCAFGTNTDQVAPTYFYEYDYISNIFTQVSSPTGGLTDDNPTFVELMLDLPDGTVLFTDASNPQLYVYKPDGSAVTNGKPVINSATRNADGSYHVTGTLFDGISEGAVYGDDWQMNSDYPIARLTNSAGAVQFCRTFNWSSSSVMTGTNILTTEMTLPAGTTNGTYPLVISANGISSDAFTLIVSSVNTTPTNIVASLSGTNLTLFWPLDHTGWRLLAQTNNLATGISPNTNDWDTVSGSASTNMIIVPIDRTKKTEFYRLIYP
jgi:Galactose oxidase, central domain